MRQRLRDIQLAARARRYGARYCLRIVRECRINHIPPSLGFAMVEQESGFRNVFGHDPTIFVGAGEVTRAKYLAYKAQRGHTHMQGVGPMQLTWWAFQDAADSRGGCWRPRYNIATGLASVATYVRSHGASRGIALYNGTGPAAEAYARSVLQRKAKWQSRLS